MWGEKMFGYRNGYQPVSSNSEQRTPHGGSPCGAPKPSYGIPCPPTPQRAAAIKNLRMIADDIKRGYGGFDYFVGYDFINITDDVLEGQRKRGQRS
jgi:hypothetical protein